MRSEFAQQIVPRTIGQLLLEEADKNPRARRRRRPRKVATLRRRP